MQSVSSLRYYQTFVPPLRFRGESPLPADGGKPPESVKPDTPAKDVADLSSAKPQSSQQQPASQAPWYTRWMEQIRTWFANLVYYLWPMNWPIFQRTSNQAAPSASVSGNKPTETGVTEKTEQDKSLAAVSSPQQLSVEKGGKLSPQAAQPPQSFLKKCLNFGLGLALNGFHVGAAVFILAGVPLLHAPIWVGLASLLGVQLFQSWVDKNQSWLEDKFPHFSVRNPEHMRQLSRSVVRKINKAMITGRNVLRKIWLVNRLAPMYSKAANGIRKMAQKGIDFAAKKLLNGTINASKIPDYVWEQGLLGKAFYFSKVILANTLQLLTGPFGHVGQWIYKAGIFLFRLQDAVDYVNAYATADKPAKPKSKPIDTPPAPGSVENASSAPIEPASAEKPAVEPPPEFPAQNS